MNFDLHNWGESDEDQKKLMSRMNNFYCGLHLLVWMADSCGESLKKFEKAYLHGKDVGSATKPELKKYHRSEK